MDRQPWIGDVALLLVSLAWGSSYITAKFVLHETEPFLFLFLRFLITVLIMLPFTLKSLIKASKDTWITGIIFGLFIYAIFSFETWGIRFTSASNSAFIISLIIILTPLVEWKVNRKFTGYLFLLAVAISFAGTALLTVKENLLFNWGDILIFTAALLRATQMTYTKKLTNGRTYDSSALTIIQLGVVAILSGFSTLIVEGPSSFYIPVSASFWLSTLYLSVVCTIFAFYAQLVFIRRTSPSRVGLLMGMEPVFGALFAVMLGGEVLTFWNVLGGLMIIGATFWGRYLLDRRNARQAQTEHEAETEHANSAQA
ncbi:DMT family transporter [Paenibacillus jiagnxiensis]|uniref:DMT family transporter n=1 Tax=Paenibacillus jiagnxiensis TaxID=3228926 RepID=UPI0033B083FA